MILYIIIFIASFALMAKAGNILVRSITGMARFFRLSEFVIAFILMSFATSVPELFIGLSSALDGVPGMSFGNIIGANFINLTLVIGAAAFFSKGIRIESKISHNNFYLIFFIAFLPVFLAMDGVISRGDGIVLILSFVLYIVRLMGEREYFSKIFNDIKINFKALERLFRAMSRFFIGALILLASSALLVWTGKELSSGINMGVLAFGAVFVALGTALPELVFGIRSAALKHSGMGVGNALGSIAFNSAFVIGLVSLISPIAVSAGQDFFITVSFLFTAFLLFNLFIYTRSAISRKESLILIFLYFAFLAVQYALQLT